VIVIHKTASVRHALSAERLGVDAVAVVGAECGGHPGLGLVGTMVQAPLAGRALRIPLSVGGGIGHGSQIAAAIAMGADAVTIGTRLTVASEIWAHRAYKERLIACDETASRLVMATFRNTYRVLDNEAARRVATLEETGVTDYEAYRETAAGARQREAYESGDIERGLLSMGQSVVFADRIAPVADIFAQLMTEARQAVSRIAGATLDQFATPGRPE
jgi:nitronate monooxygenase